MEQEALAVEWSCCRLEREKDIEEHQAFLLSTSYLARKLLLSV